MIKTHILIIGLLYITLGAFGQVQKNEAQTRTLKSFGINDICVVVNRNDTTCWYISAKTNNRFADNICINWTSREQMLKDLKSCLDLDYSYSKKEKDIYHFNDDDNTEFCAGTIYIMDWWRKAITIFDKNNANIQAYILLSSLKDMVNFIENYGKNKEPEKKKYKHFERR